MKKACDFIYIALKQTQSLLIDPGFSFKLDMFQTLQNKTFF